MKPNRRPNIVFLLEDHELYYRHGWDGGPKIRRPRFEQFARQGIEFTDAYTCGPLCCPARRSMLTGLYPHNHGMIHNYDLTPLGRDVPYDRELYLNTLADAGYRNYYYGKWHAGHGEARDQKCEGFSDENYGNPYRQPEYADYLKRRGLPEPVFFVEQDMMPEGFDCKEEKDLSGRTYVMDKKNGNEFFCGKLLGPADTHESFFLANLACEKLEELANGGSGEPFSLRVDFWSPHFPYFPTEEYANLYNPSEIPMYASFPENVYANDKPEACREDFCLGISKDDRLIYPNPKPWSEWQVMLARAYAQITMVDAAAGRILDALERLGLAENTLVVWSTDHGDAAASHGGHFDKRAYMAEEILRIPLAARFPGVIPPGQVSGELVSNLDIPPTILDAAGLSFARPVDGKSFLPLAARRDGAWRRFMVCETHGHPYPYRFGRAVRKGDYKYVHNRGDLDELYNLKTDPYELHNLIRREDCREKLRELKDDLRRWAVETGDAEYLREA